MQTMTDPIDSPEFRHLLTYRPPNAQTIAEISELADDYYAALAAAQPLRAALEAKLKAAKDAGHSWSQLRDASGFSIATIQAIVKKLEE
jgi:hypothetical protein